MLKKPALTSIKLSCYYNFLTLGSDDKGSEDFVFLDFFSRRSPLMVITPDCKMIIPLAVLVGPFETLRSINYISISVTYGCPKAWFYLYGCVHFSGCSFFT